MVIKLTKEFQARLRSLKTSGKKNQYQQAQMLLSELQMETQLSKSFRKETRIPNCYKYELPSNYRIVFQKVENVSDTFLALFVGSHADVDHYLDTHNGWIVDPVKHTLKELRLMTVEDEQVNVAVSPDLQDKMHSSQQISPDAFVDLEENHLQAAGIPEGKIQEALLLTDPNSIEVMTFLDEMPERTADLLLSYLTGSEETRNDIKLVLEGKNEFHAYTTNSHLAAIEDSPDEFIDLRELPEEKLAFDSYPLEDWMLFLHPDQKPLVTREFRGPARLRGVSGSGKTVVAIHRAQHIARKILQVGSNQYVLFITFNRSLADLVQALIEKLCMIREHERIHVRTIDKWCKDYIKFRVEGHVLGWNEHLREEIWLNSIKSHMNSLTDAKLCNNDCSDLKRARRDSDIQYLEEEVEFIFGKFIHTESDGYITCDRTGRGKGLSGKQRQVILYLYKTYVMELIKRKQYIPKEINRVAYTLLQEEKERGEAPPYEYKAVIVDEVQDLTEIELRLLRMISVDDGSNLFLVGDGAQRIYTRGYSMKNVGINVIGRSFVLKQNYRNTKEIIEAASLLMSTQEIGKYDDDPDTSKTIAKHSGHSSEKPLLMIADTTAHEWNTIAKEVHYLINKLSIPPCEICCLSRLRWAREGIQKALIKKGINAVSYKAEGIIADDAVKITGLHNSKGHEFSVVFISGLYDGSIPIANTEGLESLEKEAAVLYVAMTRAKQLLYLSYATQDGFGNEVQPSQFIAGMQEALEVVKL